MTLFLARAITILSLVVYSTNAKADLRNSPVVSQKTQCLTQKGPLPVNNQQVLEWKESTQNQFQSRGHVKGDITRIYPNKNGHYHFQIKLGSFPNDTLEVIYNEDFGKLPSLELGMSVVACGDYITSTAASKYPASPDRAIIHWVHKSPSNRHLSGFVMLNGVVYGQDLSQAGVRK